MPNPAALRQGWPRAQDPEHRVSTTLHAALLANNNTPDIDTLITHIHANQAPIPHLTPQHTHELCLLLTTDNSQLRTDGLVQVIY